MAYSQLPKILLNADTKILNFLYQDRNRLCYQRYLELNLEVSETFQKRGTDQILCHDWDISNWDVSYR